MSDDDMSDDEVEFVRWLWTALPFEQEMAAYASERARRLVELLERQEAGEEVPGAELDDVREAVAALKAFAPGRVWLALRNQPDVGNP